MDVIVIQIFLQVNVIVGKLVESLMNQAYGRLNKVLHPRTASAYLAKFKLYLAFTNWYQLQLEEIDTLLAFL